jgi:hypothetical protein
MRYLRVIFVVLLALVPGSVNALEPVHAPTTMSKVTIGLTGAYQIAVASLGTRSGCMIQYRGTGAAAFVYFGAAAPADTTTSFNLIAGQIITCNAGPLAVASDNVWVTATTADVFVVASW